MQMSRFLAICGLLALFCSVATAVDDADCNWKKLRCEPTQFCSFQYHFGDSSLDQSCRVRPGANKIPQQMHLAFAGKVAGTAMTISWATFAKVGDSAVWIGTSADRLIRRADVQVNAHSYYSEGSYSLWQYHGTIEQLKPNTKYYYVIGSIKESKFRTKVATFTTARAFDDTTAFEIPLFGDLGEQGTPGGVNTMAYLNTLKDDVPFVYHVGDISYADDDFLETENVFGFFYEEVYNHWMNKLTPLMKQVPYMVTVGNHEAECHSPACQFSNYKKDHLGNYTAYNARFKMPSTYSGGVLNMWYSFEYGPVHFTSISSETDYRDAPKNAYTATHKNGNFGKQLAWVEADLKKANENRKNVPWLIVGMHRPIYGLETSDDQGNPIEDSKALQEALEQLFIKYKVDLVVTGHVHRYERQTPIANGKAVLTGVSDDRKVYKNAAAPVYLISGSAGNFEPNEEFKPKQKREWNVVERADYGITMLSVSQTELSFRHVRSKDQEVLDEFKIIKDKKTEEINLNLFFWFLKLLKIKGSN